MFKNKINNYHLWLNLFSYRYKKSLLFFSILLMVILASYIALEFHKLKEQNQSLQKFKPISIVTLKHNMNIGEVIRKEDLATSLYYEEEFKKQNYWDNDTKLWRTALFVANSNSINKLIGRVLKIPVYQGSFLREEFLAPQGSQASLLQQISAGMGLIDIKVIQTGLHTFLKPGDLIDIYEINNNNSNLLCSKSKIILIDSLGIGEAPLQVKNDIHAYRNLSLEVPVHLLGLVASANQNSNLAITLHANNSVPSIGIIRSNPKPKIKNTFHSLTLIRGNKKEIIEQ